MIGVMFFGVMTLGRNNDSYFYTLGGLQASNMAECLKSSSSSNSCLDLWNKENADLLPDGQGTVKNLKDSTKISVCWQSHFSSSAKTCINLNV